MLYHPLLYTYFQLHLRLQDPLGYLCRQFNYLDCLVLLIDLPVQTRQLLLGPVGRRT